MGDDDDSPARPRGVYWLPNLLTTGALFAGFYAIVAAIDLRFEYAGVLAVFNFASVPRRIALPKGEWHLALDSQAPEPGEAAAQAELPAQSTRVFQRKA